MDSKVLSAERMLLVNEIAEKLNDYEEVLTDHRRLVRELDVLLNGANAAKQASLCDLVAQIPRIAREQYKAGMLRAAEICDDVPYVCLRSEETCNEACIKAIRAEAEKPT